MKISMTEISNIKRQRIYELLNFINIELKKIIIDISDIS
jgi:hypothetical protein